ncbi:2-C-methyl-D-erythritol 4-phosphate cytidylyltransferase [Bacillus andreraoultii]|uniref:2-C-methyl-D-erythritol 4-phosphate cytidylyltransferase n=1 Tax=Bacillus andreraoultii TaxID=1499685 RepID=UPI000539FCBD|nr:2-C-methyl-D-erythritol 4-phosphate cytidylyltransferase [Bacillus andreraoultii]
MEYHVIIPAAGMGKRMGADKNKLLVEIEGAPIIIHTLSVFEQDEWCKSITLVVNKHDQKEVNQLVSKYNLMKVANVVEGGKERQESVFKGLEQIEGESIILIHDGARPFVKQHFVHQLVEKAASKGAAILAVPVKDTIKKVNNHLVEETINRATLMSIQTPQAFQLSLIKEAHRQAHQDGFIGTDDASLLERMGRKVYIVEGDYDNFKITTPEDLHFAKAIIKKRNR